MPCAPRPLGKATKIAKKLLKPGFQGDYRQDENQQSGDNSPYPVGNAYINNQPSGFKTYY